jgi:hypothetical protein
MWSLLALYLVSMVFTELASGHELRSHPSLRSSGSLFGLIGSLFGLYWVSIGSLLGLLLGLYLVFIGSLLLYMDSVVIWSVVHAVYLISIWSLFGLYLVFIWSLLALYSVSIGSLFGLHWVIFFIYETHRLKNN